MKRKGHSLIAIIGVAGKYIDIVPYAVNSSYYITEIWNKKGEYLGRMLRDKKTKEFCLWELEPDMKMSEKCLKEAFKLAKNYWKQ